MLTVPALQEPQACFFSCAMGGQGVEYAAWPGRGQGIAPQYGNAVYLVADFFGININVGGGPWAMLPQGGKPLTRHAPAARSNPAVSNNGRPITPE